MSYKGSAPASDFDGLEPESSVRLPSLPRRRPIVERIMAEAILEPQVASYRRRAQFTFFCGDEPEQMAGYDGQLEVVGRCLEWFVFDCVIPELGVTPARQWYLLHADELTDQDRATAADCLNFTISIFEIAQVNPGEGITARDLLRPGKSYHISESIVSRELSPGQLLLSRLFPYQGGYMLSGMAVLMDEKAACEIKQLIHKGQLKPELILPELDGLELENLFGRSLKDIEHNTELPLLQQRLQRYWGEICPGRLTCDQMWDLIERSNDPIELIARIDHNLDFFCRSEMDLIFTLVLAVWNQTH